ncbi:MAG: tripartite tricarboxylate transporter permease [Chloroflexi bacterium]|nr:tripartite tricarboxylate transporter permease [Chloroflexota bacterium]
MLTVAFSAIVGAVVFSVLSCVPGLHAYNVLGLLTLAAGYWTCGAPEPAVAAPFVFGGITAFAMVNSIPSVLLSAPDESAFLTVLPGQKYLLRGSGRTAVQLTAAGGLGGLVVLVAVLAPLAPRVLPPVLRVLRPHIHWMVWCIIAYMLLSEWPKGGTFGPAGWRRLLDGWRSVGMGLLTFVLSGILGFILFYRSPLRVGASFQNLMPAFVGLFTLPWLLLNIASRLEVPAQTGGEPLGLNAWMWVKGLGAGIAGGCAAALLPAVTGGVGGFLAGQASGMRDDRTFLVAQGASKTLYYVGGLLLLCVPGVNLTRGGGAFLLRAFYTPQAADDYYMALASIALAGGVAYLMIGPLAGLTLRVMRCVGYRRLSAASLAGVLVIVGGVAGLAGLAVMVVAAAIGLIPPLFGTRRMNSLGVILLPIAANMSGVGPRVAGWLGLL